jgi:hypothetical protein
MLRENSGPIRISDQVAMSPAPDWFPIEIDSLRYHHTGPIIHGLPSRGLKWNFPRSLISVSGLIVQVLELQCDHGSSRSNDSLLGICVPSTIEKLGDHCFSSCKSLLAVTFEFNSKVSYIEDSAFGYCPSLLSFCVPSYVGVLGQWAFMSYNSIVTMMFEPGSALFCIEPFAFAWSNRLSVSKSSLNILSVPVASFPSSRSNPILRCPALKPALFSHARLLSESAFLHRSKSWVPAVSIDVGLLKPSHLDPVRIFAVSPVTPSGVVHHFHQFAFLPQLQNLAFIASIFVGLCQRSHLNRILAFPR